MKSLKLKNPINLLYSQRFFFFWLFWSVCTFVSDHECSFDLAISSNDRPPFTAELLTENSSTCFLHTWPSSVLHLWTTAATRDLWDRSLLPLRPPSPGLLLTPMLPSHTLLFLGSGTPHLCFLTLSWLLFSAPSPSPPFLMHWYPVLKIVICVLLFAAYTLTHAFN